MSEGSEYGEGTEGTEDTENVYGVRLDIPGDADIEAAGESVEIEIPDGEYVLAAARSQGVWLPADCQQGWCTTCTVRLVDGEVDQEDARRYYDVDQKADFVLACTAKPRSDLLVRTHQQEAMLDHRAEHDLPPGSAKR